MDLFENSIERSPVYRVDIREAIERALKGTTAVGLVTKDAVILGADKRATAGMYIAHKNVRKI
jgi:proteasome beta subunit